MQELPLVMSDWFGLCSLLQTRGTSKPMCDERERESVSPDTAGERRLVWSTYGRVRDTEELERTSGASITQQHVRWPSPWDTEFMTLSFLSLLSPSSLSLHRPVCLVFDSLFHACPEGTDLQDRFDPVVMILSFASATSFSRLQSPHKMLWIRPEDGMVGEERRGEERRGEEKRREEREVGRGVREGSMLTSRPQFREVRIRPIKTPVKSIFCLLFFGIIWSSCTDPVAPAGEVSTYASNKLLQSIFVHICWSTYIIGRPVSVFTLLYLNLFRHPLNLPEIIKQNEPVFCCWTKQRTYFDDVIKYCGIMGVDVFTVKPP